MPRVWARMTTPEGYKNSVGERVKERRLALGITQKALGGQISLHSESRWAPSEDELYGLEKRERLVSDLELKVLALSLQCSILYLLGEDETQPDVTPSAGIDSATPRRRSRKTLHDSQAAPNSEVS